MVHPEVVHCIQSIKSIHNMSVHDSNVVDVGTPPQNLSSYNWETKVVRFHGFANLPIGQHNYSPEFTCCGYQWCISIFRRAGAQGRIKAYLHNMSNEDVTVEWALSMRDSNGKEVAYYSPPSDAERRFRALDLGASMQNAAKWGTSNFADYSDIRASLEQGTLKIDVRMKRMDDSIQPTSCFVPKYPLCKYILNKFNEEESADVKFEVDSASISEQGGDEGGGKRAKTTTTFHAHRLILQDGAPLLAELCKPSAGGGSVATVLITDVKPDIFRHMLYYLYGGKLTDEELKANARDIIDAADKYGVVHLKLDAEACYVKSTTITLENMMGNLLYADSKNCALLKEAVIDFVVENGEDVLKKVSLENVPGGVFADLLTAVTRKEKSRAACTNNEQDISMMRVSELRMKLDKKGLDVDGSREAMIAALQESKSEC